MLPPLLILLISCTVRAQLVISPGEELDLADFSHWMASAAYSLDISGRDVAAADTVELPTGEVLQFHDRPLVDGERGYATYEFEHEGTDAEAEFTVGEADDDVFATIRDREGQAYVVTYLGEGGGHAWLVGDMQKLDDMSDRDDSLEERHDRELGSILSSRNFTQSDIAAAYQKGLNDSETVAQLSVKAYFTEDYENVTSDVQGSVEHIVASTNQGFINSGVRINLTLLCVERYLGPEIRDGGDMFREFAKYKGTEERLHGTADLTFLLVRDSDVCGMGNYNTTDFPLSLVESSCAMYSYTTFHELGHNLGAHHDKAQVGHLRGSYGRGYMMDNSKRTAMSYNSDRRHWKRINYYSDDADVDNEGDILGSPTEDNSRIVQERRFMYELIGDESAKDNCTGDFSPDMTEGIVQWGEWENYGCVDGSLMTRSGNCTTKYFPCGDAAEAVQSHDCGGCANVENSWSCQFWADVGYCHNVNTTGFMAEDCKWDCPNLCPRSDEYDFDRSDD